MQEKQPLVMVQNEVARHPIHLCIGAPRSGTTWLFNNLNRQESVFTPAIKEVRYWFSRRNQLQVAKEAACAVSQLDQMHDANLQKRWIEYWGTIDPRKEPDSETYRKLMSVGSKPSIDISPAYSFMPRRYISLAHDALPASSKVVFFARDPMSRIVSQMKLHWYMHGSFRGLASLARHQEFVKDPMQMRRSDYRRITDNWRHFFGDRFRVYYYEDMKRRPGDFLSEVCDFLEIDLDEGIAGETSEKVFGTNTISLPKPGPNERKILAEAVLPMVQSFAEIAPERARRWMGPVNAALESGNPARDFVDDCSPKVQNLMRMTESLGDNCEYGFWQRHRGYEPSSLFRWAITPAESLARYIKILPAKMYFEDALSVYSPGMVDDSTFGFKFHSKLVERREDGEVRLIEERARRSEVYLQEKKKNDHLVLKFQLQLRTKPCVYIIKCNKGIDRGLVEQIRDSIVAYNIDHRVLWVEQGENFGQIEEIGPGLLRGEIDGFARYVDADKYTPNGWTTLMHGLAEREDITGMINTMAR